ncbi:MAG: hypothetical protein LBD85_06465 [Oscillospiraceae bacterium]|jgi:hypothetical protein|nr:hypothetical protein [Oscillospiraceae bacterium]
MNISKLPLAHGKASVIFCRENGANSQKPQGWYVGIKPARGAGLGFEHMLGAAQSGGVLQLQIFDTSGAETAYDVTADYSSATITSPVGELKIAIDAPVNALRIEGNVPSLRLFKQAAAGMGSGSTLNLPDGAELNSGGRIVLKVLTGKHTFDDTWLIKQWSSVPADLRVTARNGKISLAMFSLGDYAAVPEITRSIADCAADSQADFTAFKGKLSEPIDETEAYSVWAFGTDDPFVFADAELALETALAHAKSSARKRPAYAAAVSALYVSGKLSAAGADKKRELISVIRNQLNWWNTYRFDAASRRYFYAYAGEYGGAPSGDSSPKYDTELHSLISALDSVCANLETEVR